MPSREVARTGGLERIRIYGNPGTAEGRRKGGLNSILRHKQTQSGFKLIRAIKKPRPSLELAELLGIYMGDGHVSPYQSSVVTNSITDIEHAFFVKVLQEKLFSIPVSIQQKTNANALIILASSRELSIFLSRYGMPIGNKLMQGLVVPSWILRKDSYMRAFVRGLIDTDGSVYRDSHIIKNVLYQSTCIAFTNASKNLTDFVFSFFVREGYSPTRSGRDVRLRRKKDIQKYVKEIGFNNPKHARKIEV
jgi:intein/homing endonuclease